MHGCKIGEQGASDKLDNIVRFWCNIPFKKNSKITQTRKSISLSGGAAFWIRHQWCQLIKGILYLSYFFFYTGVYIAEKKTKQFLSEGCKHLKSRLQPLIGWFKMLWSSYREGKSQIAWRQHPAVKWLWDNERIYKCEFKMWIITIKTSFYRRKVALGPGWKTKTPLFFSLSCRMNKTCQCHK